MKAILCSVKNLHDARNNYKKILLDKMRAEDAKNEKKKEEARQAKLKKSVEVAKKLSMPRRDTSGDVVLCMDSAKSPFKEKEQKTDDIEKLNKLFAKIHI